MSDYIKREDAINVACGDCPYNCSEVRKKTHPCMEYKQLMAIPSADVAPVRHGRWVKHGVRDRMTCSCCGDYWEMGLEWTSDNFKGWFKFCPNCGAKMDEEKDDE